MTIILIVLYLIVGIVFSTGWVLVDKTANRDDMGVMILIGTLFWPVLFVSFTIVFLLIYYINLLQKLKG